MCAKSILDFIYNIFTYFLEHSHSFIGCWKLCRCWRFFLMFQMCFRLPCHPWLFSILSRVVKLLYFWGAHCFVRCLKFKWFSHFFWCFKCMFNVIFRYFLDVNLDYLNMLFNLLSWPDSTKNYTMLEGTIGIWRYLCHFLQQYKVHLFSFPIIFPFPIFFTS